MARRPRGGRRDEIARAILEEFGVETADEAQEALRQILGPTIEAMLRAELDAHLGYASNDKSPKATANRRNGYTPRRSGRPPASSRYRSPGTATARSSRSRCPRAARTSPTSSPA